MKSYTTTPKSRTLYIPDLVCEMATLIDLAHFEHLNPEHNLIVPSWISPRTVDSAPDLAVPRRIHGNTTYLVYANPREYLRFEPIY